MKAQGFVYLFLFLGGMFATVQAEKKPPFNFNLVYEELVSIREDLKAGKQEVVLAYENLIKKADAAMKEKHYQVIDGDVPPTGDIHDFYTIGKQSWKNPDTKSGLPYIRKDGKTNPESEGDNYDMKRFNKTVFRVNLFALAWFYSQKEEYAKKATEQLRVWFTDPTTKMNPNFNCASALPGVYDGMPIGIIFGAQLVNMIDHVQLLTLSESWTKEDNDKLKKWFDEYAAWLLMSDFGVIEGRATNNHGSWYSAQLAACAIYNGRIELAKNTIETARQQLMQQVAGKDTIYEKGSQKIDCPKGSLPREMYRADAFSYSRYGLQAFCTLAGCANAIGEDLWNYKVEDGRGLKLAFDFITPYFVEQKEWIWRTLGDKKNIALGALPLVRQAANIYKTQELKDATTYLISISAKSSDKAWLLGKLRD